MFDNQTCSSKGFCNGEWSKSVSHVLWLAITFVTGMLRAARSRGRPPRHHARQGCELYLSTLQSIIAQLRIAT
jgi:hypothetical protein